MLEDILERFKEQDEFQQKQSSEKKEKLAEDAEKALEMRQKSLETFAETRKRTGDPDQSPVQKRRNSGNDTINYLTQRNETEAQLRSQELELRKEELENTRALQTQELEVRKEEAKNTAEILRQQSQMMQLFIQNQQAQQNAVMGLLEKVMKSP